MPARVLERLLAALHQCVDRMPRGRWLGTQAEEKFCLLERRLGIAVAIQPQPGQREVRLRGARCEGNRPDKRLLRRGWLVGRGERLPVSQRRRIGRRVEVRRGASASRAPSPRPVRRARAPGQLHRRGIGVEGRRGLERSELAAASPSPVRSPTATNRGSGSSGRLVPPAPRRSRHAGLPCASWARASAQSAPVSAGLLAERRLRRCLRGSGVPEDELDARPQHARGGASRSAVRASPTLSRAAFASPRMAASAAARAAASYPRAPWAMRRTDMPAPPRGRMAAASSATRDRTAPPATAPPRQRAELFHHLLRRKTAGHGHRLADQPSRAFSFTRPRVHQIRPTRRRRGRGCRARCFHRFTDIFSSSDAIRACTGRSLRARVPGARPAASRATRGRGAPPFRLSAAR